MGKITINELHKSLYNYAQAVSDENLMTESKTIVGAINEIYGKNLIADSIGEPLNNTDTYSKMSSDINNLLSTFKTNMMNAGVAIESNDKFKQLIEKIKGLTEGEGNKGIQYTKLTGQWEIQSNQSTGNKTISIPLGLDFTPSIIICYFPTYAAYGFGGGAYFYNLSGQQNVIVANNIPYINAQNSNSKMEITNISSESISISNGFYTPDGERYYFLGGICTEIYAIGVGEEDTTLRDSLANILENKGVNVTEEDDMASLITKVDSIETGGGLDISIVESLPDTVTENKLCVIAPVTDGMIYVDRLDKDEAVSTYSFNTDDYFVRLVLSESTNTFVTTSTSGNVVEKYLIGGIYRYDGSGLVLADNIYKGSNGEWVQIFDVLLVFSNGLQNGTRIVNSESSSCKGYVSGGGTTLTLKYLSIGATDIAFKNSLDITDYNKLVLVVESTSFSTSSSSLISFDLYDSTDTYVNIGLDTTVGDISGWTKGQLIEIDVSSLSGPHYLRVNKQAVNINGTIVLSEIYFTK